MDNLRLNFSHNWNHKLGCDIFTTIRPHGSTVLVAGNVVDIYLTGKEERYMGTAEVLFNYGPYTVDTLPGSICYLDTGYNPTETRAIIHRMYGAKNDMKTMQFAVYYLKYLRKA